ncbi:MAG: hypothetical protein HYZ75_06425 [Elusimicrobia bacterium]|nr:hypothetical protein [Elusimicrobiota bacterium]
MNGNPDGDAFRIGQLAKELVAIHLQATEDPSAVAAAMVRETTLVALKSRPQDADAVIADACCGSLQALLLSGHDLSRGAALMLAEVQDLAGPLRINPAVLTDSVLAGFARMRRFMSQEQLIDMLETLESRFAGAGAAFAKALARQPGQARRVPVS